MKTDKSKQVRPLRVFVGHGTKAEKGFRSRMSMPETEAIAPGVAPTPSHDLVFHGGHTIQDLVFTNFYVGGSAAWNASDIQNIDKALAGSMSDADLNNVMVQYFASGKITSTFEPSQILAGPPPQVVSQGDIENLVLQLFQAGGLNGFDFTSTVFNFMLPSGTILNTNTAPTNGAIVAQLEKPMEARKGVSAEGEEDSTQGLGGYHGSVHAGSGSNAQIVYYAVGVYSETLPDGTVNGIPVFDQSWKSVVATFYHELNEARTDPDVEDAERDSNDNLLGWYNNTRDGGEIGDIPMNEAGQNLRSVMVEVALAAGGTAPIQLMWSNAVHGPEGPFALP